MRGRIGNLVLNGFEFSLESNGVVSSTYICVKSVKSQCRAVVSVPNDRQNKAKLIHEHNHDAGKIDTKTLGNFFKYKKVKNAEGKDQIIINNHLFRKHDERNNSTVWTCIHRNTKQCKSRAIVYQKFLTNEANLKRAHNHPSVVPERTEKTKSTATSERDSEHLEQQNLSDYEFKITQNGKERIEIDGHLFRKNIERSSYTNWVCTQIMAEKCDCRATTFKARYHGKASVRGSHNHSIIIHEEFEDFISYRKLETENQPVRILINGHWFKKHSEKGQTIVWSCDRVDIDCKCFAQAYKDYHPGKAIVKGIHNHDIKVDNSSGNGSCYALAPVNSKTITTTVDCDGENEEDSFQFDDDETVHLSDFSE